MLIVICLVTLDKHLIPARAETPGASVTILDKKGEAITQLTDGDTIRIRLEVPSKAEQQTLVSFRLIGLDQDITECTLQVGQSGCVSGSFASLGWFWNQNGQPQPERVVQALANRTVISTSNTIQIVARPVVMVHGFSSNWEAWLKYLGPQGYLAGTGMRGFAVGDGQVTGVMNTGNLTNPPGKTNTIAENAAVLGQYIEGVRQQTGAQKVDLLVHSLGGLIARYYIDRLMPEGEVVNLLILGSPMSGTGCANLPAALGFYLPAVLEFQPSYVQDIFNPQIIHRRGVVFSALAGTPLVNPLQSPCTPVPSDIAVSRDSVNGIQMEVSEMAILHTELNTSADVYNQFVLPHLRTPPGEFTTPSDPPILSRKVEPLQFTRVYTGHINPGEVNDLSINIDPNVAVASFALYDSSHSLDIQVTGASGKVLTLDPVANGLIQVDDPESLVYLGYGFNNPKPGVWKVKLMPAEKTPATGADYAITAVFQGGATLSTQASVLTPRLNQPVQLNASLELNGQQLVIDQAQALIRSSDNTLQTVDMEQIADSNDVQVKWIPSQPGLYGIEIRVNAKAPDGFPIERTAFLNIEAQPHTQRTVMGILSVIGVVVFVGAVIVGLIWLMKRKKQPVS